MSPPPEAFPDPQPKATCTTSAALSPSMPYGSWNCLVHLIFHVCVCLPLLGSQRSYFSQAPGLVTPQPYPFATLRPQAVT